MTSTSMMVEMNDHGSQGGDGMTPNIADGNPAASKRRRPNEEEEDQENEEGSNHINSTTSTSEKMTSGNNSHNPPTVESSTTRASDDTTHTTQMETPAPAATKKNETTTSTTKKKKTKPKIVDAPWGPVFYPTVEDMEGSPLKYLEKIKPIAERYGIAKIVPPKGWTTNFFGTYIVAVMIES
jgi:jmjN domain